MITTATTQTSCATSNTVAPQFLTPCPTRRPLIGLPLGAPTPFPTWKN